MERGKQMIEELIERKQQEQGRRPLLTGANAGGSVRGVPSPPVRAIVAALINGLTAFRARALCGSQTESEVYYIPAHRAGSIIGKGGATVRDLERRSGAILHISSEPTSGSRRAITIEGDEAARTRAKVLIDELTSDEIIREVRNRASRLVGWVHRRALTLACAKLPRWR